MAHRVLQHALISCAALALACQAGESPIETGPGAATRGYHPTRFRFMPGPPGRAVGIHAIASMPRGETQTHEIEIELLDSRGAGSPSNAALATEQAQAHPQALCSTAEGETTHTFETVGNSICWIGVSFATGIFGGGGSTSANVLLTREGRYAVRSWSMDVYVPPDLGNFSNVASVGCLAGEGDQVTLERLGELSSLGISTSRGAAIPIGLLPSLSIGVSAGYSIFLERGGLAPAFQYDTSLVSLSVGLLPIPVELRLQTMSGFMSEPVLIARNANACGMAEVNAFASPSSTAPNGQDAAALADELIQPLMDHLADETGFGPGTNMVAGSNADAWASLGGPGTIEGKATLPPASFDDLLQDVEAKVLSAPDNEARTDALASSAFDLGNALPSPILLDGLLRRAAIGVELIGMLDARAEAASPRVSREVMRITGKAGEPVTLIFTAAELATLLRVEAANVLGATLSLSASHTLSPSEHVLDGAELTLSFTPSTTTPILVRTRVDLSTAVGPFDETFDDVEIALRLILIAPGPAAQVGLDSVGRVAAGGAVTLNAVVTDEQGNLADEPVEVMFRDGEGAILGSATRNMASRYFNTFHGQACLGLTRSS